MIIDAHAHVFANRAWAPEAFWSDYKKTLAARLASTAEDVERDVLPDLWDPDGRKLIQEMDALGIDRSVIVCLDYGLLGKEEISVERLHDEYAALIQSHKDRLLFCTCVDPRRPDAEAILTRSIRELGARMLKLYAPAGFYPNDESLYPIYRRCLEEGIPVMHHIGPAPALSFRSKYSQPVYIDDVAADFPELTIVMAHAGYDWWRDALGVARARRNVWVDLSGWGRLLPHRRYILEPLREFLDLIPGRVLFGTDRIGLPGGIGDFLDVFQNPGEDAPMFTEDEMGDFLSGATTRLLGLE